MTESKPEDVSGFLNRIINTGNKAKATAVTSLALASYIAMGMLLYWFYTHAQYYEAGVVGILSLANAILVWQTSKKLKTYQEVTGIAPKDVEKFKETTNDTPQTPQPTD